MKITIFHAARTVALLVLASAGWTALSAQEAVPVPVAPVVIGRGGLVSVTRESPSSDPIRFDFDFPGGTVVEFVDAVGKAQGTPVNVAIPEANKGALIPPMKMTQVNVKDLLNAASSTIMEFRPGRQGRDRFNNLISQESYRVGYKFDSIGENVWLFGRWPEPKEQVVPLDESVVFFNLEPYLGQYSIDDIITVLEAGNQLRPNSEPLGLKFHKETKLLVVRGTPQDLNLVKSALAELRRNDALDPQQRPTPIPIQPVPVRIIPNPSPGQPE